MKNMLLECLSRNDSLDLIQKYVEERIEVKNFNKNSVSSEMFRLFSNVIELGKEIRISKDLNNNINTESKIADIFLVLVSICNSMNINLFDALVKKENDLKVVI